MRKLLSWGVPLLSLLASTLPVQAVSTDAQIEAILKQRINREKQSPGIVVGIIDPQGQRIISYGSVPPRPIVSMGTPSLRLALSLRYSRPSPSCNCLNRRT
jgi:hypothetical protein